MTFCLPSLRLRRNSSRLSSTYGCWGWNHHVWPLSFQSFHKWRQLGFMGIYIYIFFFWCIHIYIYIYWCIYIYIYIVYNRIGDTVYGDLRGMYMYIYIYVSVSERLGSVSAARVLKLTRQASACLSEWPRTCKAPRQKRKQGLDRDLNWCLQIINSWSWFTCDFVHLSSSNKCHAYLQAVFRSCSKQWRLTQSSQEFFKSQGGVLMTLKITELVPHGSWNGLRGAWSAKSWTWPSWTLFTTTVGWKWVKLAFAEATMRRILRQTILRKSFPLHHLLERLFESM